MNVQVRQFARTAFRGSSYDENTDRTEPKQTTRLAGLEERCVLMEAHTGLCAKLAQEAGSEALWGLDGSGDRSPAVIATTAKLSRELFELDDREFTKRNRFYIVGSMGCAAGFGLGVARALPERPIVVLDGDGALMIKMASLATVGSLGSRNYHQVVFENGAHGSEGGQPTPSPCVDFASVALACGYRYAETISDTDKLQATLEPHVQTDGPTLLRVVITTGSRKDLGRPDLSPRDGYLPFSAFLTGQLWTGPTETGET